MPKMSKDLLEGMSLGELQHLTATKEQLDALEARKAALETELAKVTSEIGGLLDGLSATSPVKKKAVSKKPGRKKVAKRVTKAPKKRVAKATTKKKAVRAGKKVAAKKAPGANKKAATKAPRVTVESVVVDLLKASDGPMSFQDILATVTKKKLIKSKSANFANVLRRTVSTSKKIKRVSRGTYKA